MRQQDTPTSSPFPDIPKPLLEELNRRFPDRCPSPDHTDRLIWMAVGARKVVEFLNEQFKRQEEKRLLTNVVS